MTCIVGVKHNETVYVGGDGISMMGENSRFPSGENKVFQRRNMLLGVCGSARWLNLLKYTADFPQLTSATAAWLNLEFSVWLRELARTHGLLLSDKDIGDDADLSILIGCRGELYTITRDFAANRIMRDYHAIGSGRDVALGSLYTSQTLSDSPETRIMWALDAATEMTTSVGRPYTVMEL